MEMCWTNISNVFETFLVLTRTHAFLVPFLQNMVNFSFSYKSEMLGLVDKHSLSEIHITLEKLKAFSLLVQRKVPVREEISKIAQIWGYNDYTELKRFFSYYILVFLKIPLLIRTFSNQNFFCFCKFFLCCELWFFDYNFKDLLNQTDKSCTFINISNLLGKM